MTISLVTGAAGFVGSHVAKHLRDMGHTVVVLDDLSGGFRENVPDGCIFEQGSILDTALINDMFAKCKFDFVFHLAAYAAESLSHHVRRFNYETNLIGSVNLINAAVNAGTVRRFVFSSSAAVYGEKATSVGSTDEAQAPAPIDPYGIAKYAVEMDLRAAYEMFGLPYTIFRPYNVYGERQNLSDGYRNVVAIFIRQCLMGHPMSIFGDGNQVRTFSYIGDVAPCIAQSVEMSEARNQIINIGAAVPYTVNTLAERVADALDAPYFVDYLPKRHEANTVTVSNQKATQIFGWHEKTLLDDGLATMAAWAKTQPLREPRAFDGIEIERSLPEHWRTLSEHR